MSIRSFCAQLSASGRLKDRDAALAELKNALDDRDTRIALSPEAWSQLCIHFARYVELELLLPRSAGKGDAATPTTDRQNARALQHADGLRFILERADKAQRERSAKDRDSKYVLAASTDALYRHMLGVLGLTWTDGFRPVVIAYLRLLNTRLLGVRAYRNHIPRALWKPYIELLFGRILSEPSLTTASSTEAAQTIGLLFISSANALGTEASVIWRFFHAVYVDRQALEAPLHHVLMPALGHFLLDWCSRTRLTDHVADMVAISTACMAHWSSRNESYRNGIVFFQRAVLEVLATDVAGGGQLDAASFDMVDDIWRMCAIRKALDGHLQMSAQLFVEAGAESLESWRPVVGADRQSTLAIFDMAATALHLRIHWNERASIKGHDVKRRKIEKHLNVWQELRDRYECGVVSQKIAVLQLLCALAAKYPMDLDGSSLVASILQAAPISDRHDPSIAPWCRLLLAGVVGNGSLSHSEKSTCFQAWALECPDAVTDITTSALLVRRFVDQNIASRSQTRRFMVRLIAHWGSIGSSVLPTTRDLFLLMELIDEGPLWTAFARKLSSDLSMSFSTTAYRLARSLSATDTTSDELHMTEDAHVLAWRFSRLLSSIRITCGEIGKPKVMDAHRGTHCSSGFKGFLSAIELDDLRLEEQDHRALAALAKTIISTTDTDRMVVERVSKILDALSSKIMDKSTAMDSITSILELMLGLRAKGVEYSIYDAHGDTESSVNQVTTPRLALVRELAALPWMTTFINRCEELLLFCFSDTSGDGDVDERHVNWAMRASLQAQFLDIPKQKRRESNFRRLLLELFKLLAVAHPDSAQRAKCSALVIDVLFSCGKRLTVEGISAAHFITPTSISSDTERAELRRDILDHVQLLARSYYVENDALALHFVATLLKGIASLGPDHHGHDSTYSALYAWCARQQSEIGQQQLPDILRLHYESARFAGADGVYISDALSLLTSDSVPVCMASTRALIAVGQRSDYASDVVFDRAIDAIRMNVEANRFLAVNSLSIAMICEFIAASAHAFPRAFILVAEYGTSHPSDKLLLALATAAGFASVQSMLTQSMPFLWYQWRSRRPALERVPSYFFDIKLNESDACLVKPVGILLHLFPNSWKELANSYKDENTMALIEDGFTTLLSCAIITDVCTGDESAVSAVSLSLGLPVFRARVLKHITTIALICAVLIAEQDIQAAGKIVRRAHSDDKLLEKFFPEDEMRQRANIIATMWAMVKQKISACMEVENDSILDPTHVFLLLAHLATQCKNAVLPTRKRDLLLVVLTLTALQQANRADSSHCFCERATIELCDIVHETPQHATLIDLFLSALVVRCAPRAEVITAVVKAMDSGIVAHLQSVHTGSFFHEARMFLKRANVMFVAACELSPCTSASGIEEIVDSVNLLPAGSANLPAYWNRIDTDFATISVGSCDGINALQACKRLKQLACRIKRVIDDKLAEISNGENNDSRLNDSAFFLLSTIAPFVELTCSSDNTAVHTVVDHEDAFVQTLVHRLLVGRATIAEAALASLQALSRSRDKLWLDLLSSTPGMSELLHQSDKSAAAVQLNMGDGDDSHTFPAKSRNGVSDIWTVRTHSALVAVLPAHDILRDPAVERLCRLDPSVIVDILPTTVSRVISHLNSRAAKPEDRNRLAGFINVGLDPSRADYQEARVILLQVISAIRRLSPGAAFDGPKLHVHVDYGKAAEASMEEGDAVSAVHYMEISRELLASQGSHLMSGGEIAICDLAERVLNMVDEPDLRYGLRSYSDLQTAFSHAFAEGDFGTSLMFFDAQRNQMSDERTSARLAQSLYGLGVHHTLTRLLSSTAESQSEASQVDDLVDLQYALAWKYARWDWSPSAVVSVTDSKNQLIFNGFRRVKDISVASPTSSGDILAGILVPLRSLTNPNSKNVDNPAVFHFLREAAEAQTLASWTGAHWLARLKPLEQNFERSEEMIFWRIRLLLEVLDDRTRPDCAQRGRLHDELIAHGNCYLDLTLTNRRPQFAMNMWSLMECSRTLLNHFLSDRQKFDWDVMQTMGAARILWETGQNLAATTLLKSLIGRMAASGSVDYDSETSWRTRQVQFDTLLKLGQWTAAIHSEPPEIIVKEYFGKALTLASEAHIAMDTDAKRYTIGNVHYELAKFSDAEYSRFIGSELFAASDQVLRMQEAEIRIYDSQLKSERNAAAKKRLTALRKKACVQLELDRRDRQRRLQEHMCFLERALSGYLRTLALCDYHDDCVYRFCSLWLGLDAMYSGASENGHAIRETAKELSAVESRKFVPLIYQLSAKLSSIPEAVLRLPFGESLFSLVARIARDHPHHCIYQLIALTNSEQSAMNSAASSIIDQLGVADRYHRRLVVESCNLVDAFVELTELDMKRFQGGGTGSGKTKTSFSLDSAFKLSKLKMMETAAVTTATIPVRVDACYEGNVPLVRGFHSQFRLVGGVNIPKLIECHGDDGLTYKILVKGKDDLRQDAVLQQIFARVHEFLGRDTETRRRTLGIRTYKVVPLSPRVGVVEWVDGTVPLGSWLCSAHSRLRPSDLKPQEAREMLRVESERKSSTAADKAAVFQRLLGRFHPVFRHYFFESYAEPCKWFECRLRYVRSVATTSITGFVLGIGDRHPFNILIDQSTGELVHIDLGIAFDLGSLLSVPEVVPFRLTQDLVDAMGVTRVDGTFHRCSEFTLKVLRNEESTLAMILEVLQHDPLYTWTLSPVHQKTQRRRRHGEESGQLIEDDDTFSALERQAHNVEQSRPQQGDGGSLQIVAAESRNKDAQRALVGVRRKLSAGNGSIICHVNELIRDATSAENLAQMFHGWQPYM